MTLLSHHKVVGSLPGTLEPNAIYYVRVGDGFDQYMTNSLGVAKPLNHTPRHWQLPISGLFKGKEGEVISAKTPSGPYSGNNNDESLGLYPTPYLTNETPEAQGYAVPWRCKITGFRAWKYVENTLFEYRFVVLKSKIDDALGTDTKTLMYESASIIESSLNPSWHSADELDFSSNDIAADENLIFGVAGVTGGDRNVTLIGGLISLEEII